jgi:hypothetical protein
MQANGNTATIAGFLAGAKANDLHTQASPSRFLECRKKHRAAFSQCWEITFRLCAAPTDENALSCLAKNLSVERKAKSAFDGEFS